MSTTTVDRASAAEGRRIAGIAAEGLPFVGVPLAIAVPAFAIGWWPLGALMLALAAFSAFFFRDPRRAIPPGENNVVSPADGKVIFAREDESGAHVAIFLNVFNVHVNRTPVAGAVTDVEYTEGRFLAAWDERAQTANERSAMTLDTRWGKVVVSQIAGLVARRIVNRAQVGETLRRGGRFGLIRFGSRTDVILPVGASVSVKAGDKVRGGSTIVATFADVAD